MPGSARATTPATFPAVIRRRAASQPMSGRRMPDRPCERGHNSPGLRAVQVPCFAHLMPASGGSSGHHAEIARNGLATHRRGGCTELRPAVASIRVFPSGHRPCSTKPETTYRLCRTVHVSLAIDTSTILGSMKAPAYSPLSHAPHLHQARRAAISGRVDALGTWQEVIWA